jgi:hypothetical protein
MLFTRVDPGLAWGFFGFLFPASIAVLAARYWRQTPPSIFGDEVLSPHPDSLVMVAHLIALAHVVCVIGAVVCWREWRGVVVVASLIQLFVTAWAWFIAQMALTGAWL